MLCIIWWKQSGQQLTFEEKLRLTFRRKELIDSITDTAESREHLRSVRIEFLEELSKITILIRNSICF